MIKEDLLKRTKDFCIRVFRLLRQLNLPREELFLKSQLLRSSTSIACNYRSACRSQSRKGFIAKISIVIEEADESIFWLELIDELHPEIKLPEVKILSKEAVDLQKIFTSIRITMTRNAVKT